MKSLNPGRFYFVKVSFSNYRNLLPFLSTVFVIVCNFICSSLHVRPEFPLRLWNSLGCQTVTPDALRLTDILAIRPARLCFDSLILYVMPSICVVCLAHVLVLWLSKVIPIICLSIFRGAIARESN